MQKRGDESMTKKVVAEKSWIAAWRLNALKLQGLEVLEGLVKWPIVGALIHIGWRWIK